MLALKMSVIKIAKESKVDKMIDEIRTQAIRIKEAGQLCEQKVKEWVNTIALAKANIGTSMSLPSNDNFLKSCPTCT